MLLKQIVETAPALATELVRRWGRETAASPWLRLPVPAHAADVERLIRLLAGAAAEAGTDDRAARELARMAVAHGRTRRTEGFAEDTLFREYHRLRRTLWELFRDRYEGPDARQATLEIGRAITLATSASLYGFNAPDEAEDALVEQVMEVWGG